MQRNFKLEKKLLKVDAEDEVEFISGYRNQNIHLPIDDYGKDVNKFSKGVSLYC